MNATFNSIGDYLADLNYKFDNIAISETWLDSNRVDNYNLDGDDYFHSVRDYKGGGGGGGVLICVNCDLTCKFLPHKSVVVEGLLETITIAVIIPGHKNILITCLYRTIGSNIHNFVDCLEQLFSGLSVLKTIFICGDFNTNILKHDSDHGVNLFLDTMYSVGLYPLIDGPPRITNHSFTLIDNIFTNAGDYDNASGLLIYDVSDHLPVFCHL